jgi:hypothetical protein
MGIRSSCWNRADEWGIDVGELFPLLAGILAGVIALRLTTARARTACLIAMGLVFGTIATVVNGEEFWLVPVDAAIVVVTGGVIVNWRRIAARVRPAGGGERARRT